MTFERLYTCFLGAAWRAAPVKLRDGCGVVLPVLRSSWQQFVIFRLFFLTVIFGLDPNIQEIDARVKPEHDDYLLVIPRLNRGIQEIPGSRCACPRMTKKT